MSNERKGFSGLFNFVSDVSTLEQKTQESSIDDVPVFECIMPMHSETTTPYANFNKKVIVCESSDDFYDKMFQERFVSDFFGMPQYQSFIEKRNIHVADEDNQHGLIAGYAFLWLCNIYKQNPKLHKHVLSLAVNIDDGKNIIGEDRKEFVLCSLGPKSEQLFSDSKALDAIFIRVHSYHFLIKRLMGCLFSFYSEHQNNINYYLSHANRDYPPTDKISSINHFTIQDIDRIFLRDILGGKDLVVG